MSKPRKSFLLHFDSLGILDKLTKEQAGELFIACRDYNLGKELELDPILELVFFSFKSQFDRDMEKYQNIVDRNKSNGSRGGRPEKPKEPKKPTGLTGNPKKARKADSVNDSDSDNKSDSDSKKEISDLSTATKPPKFSVDDFNCAEWFFSLLLQLNPKHKKPNIEAWADDVRKIINIDNRTYQEISDLMLWVNKDSFWQTNILSPKKLREKWDALTIQKNKVRHNKTEARTLNNLSVGEDFLNEH